MNKLFWISLSVVATTGLLSGCKVTIEGCDTDADCAFPLEEFCDVDGFCSDRLDYAGCFDSSDCVDQDCVEVTTTAGTTGTLCTFGCDVDSDCPPNLGFEGACYSPTAAGDFICFQTCGSDIDCELNSRCVDVFRTDGLLDAACIPGA